MAVITGKDGDVKIGTTQVAEIGDWTFDAEVETFRYASNKTAGKKKTISGSSQATGTLTGFYDPFIPVHTQLKEGDEVTLDLIFGSFGTPPVVHKIVAPARIKNLKYKTDINTGAIVGFTADWESNGTWTYPSAAV